MPFEKDAVQHFADAAQAADFAASEIAKSCRDAVQQRGVFHWVLAGGGTPELCYRLLSHMELPWAAVHCWFGDERALPAGDAERNETMARNALLNKVAIPASQIHSIEFPASTEEAAERYAQELAHIPDFDLVMLGMGEDGHTASLFPDNPALENSDSAVPVFNSPKPPAQRVSMSLKRLNQHRKCLILATGATKEPILKAILSGASPPVTRIDNAVWIVDQAAWPV